MNLRILLFVCLLGLPGCATMNSETNAKSLLETLEFGPEEEGCFRLSGVIDLNPFPFWTSNVNLLLVKTKGKDVPGC